LSAPDLLETAEGLTLSMVKAIMSGRGDEIGFGLKGCGGVR
jgi:hypothetical protein